MPNFGSWHRRVFGTRWFQLDLPRHLQHFDRDSLGGLVAAPACARSPSGASSMLPSLLGSIQYSTFGNLRYGGRGFRIVTWAMLPIVALSDLIGEGDCLHLTAEA